MSVGERIFENQSAFGKYRCNNLVAPFSLDMVYIAKVTMLGTSGTTSVYAVLLLLLVTVV